MFLFSSSRSGSHSHMLRVTRESFQSWRSVSTWINSEMSSQTSVTSLPLTYPSNLHSHRLWMICCMPNEEHGNRWIQKLDSCGVLLPPAWSCQGQCSFALKNKVRVRLTRASLHRPDWPLHTGLTLLKHRIRASAQPSIYMDSYKAEGDILQCPV